MGHVITKWVRGSIRGASVSRSISCLVFGLLSAPSVFAQSPEEHARHHPGTSPAAGAMRAATASSPGMTGTGSPAAATGPTAAAGGMMAGMGEMMAGMGKPPPKELYPSLMSLPELTAENRREVEQRAEERVRAGTTLMGQALDALNVGARSGDYAAMHEATTLLREGIAQFDSGIAARRALAEGGKPGDIALRWFRSEMNLLPAAVHDTPKGWLGISPFHFFVMVILVGSTVAMVWMYFHKMRRAALLLQNLTGSAQPAPPTAVASTEVAASAPATAPSRIAAPAETKWSGKLRVGRIFQETTDVKTFRLMNPLGGALPFSYLPGQFLTVTVIPDGKPVRRSYTIASSPTQHDYAEITIKHAHPGVVSEYLHNQVHEGDLLECSGPSGSFTFTGRECKCILLIGGGVGITPLMSVLRYLTDRSWPGDIFLIYGCHSPREIIFREELDFLQRRHPNLHVSITVSHPEGTDWKGQIGRITKELIAQTVPDVPTRYVHICGPVPLMESIKKMLAELGVPKERIKTEAFGPVLGKPEPSGPAAPTASTRADTTLPKVSFSVSDKSAALPPDKTVLDVADEIGVEIDNSCRVGTCGTCRVKLLSGHVKMAVEDGLEPGDKEKGIILACQAKAAENLEVEA